MNKDLSMGVEEANIDVNELQPLGVKLRRSYATKDLGGLAKVLRKVPKLRHAPTRSDLKEAVEARRDRKQLKKWRQKSNQPAKIRGSKWKTGRFSFKTQPRESKKAQIDSKIDLISVAGSASSNDSRASLWSLVMDKYNRKKLEEEKAMPQVVNKVSDIFMGDLMKFRRKLEKEESCSDLQTTVKSAMSLSSIRPKKAVCSALSFFPTFGKVNDSGTNVNKVIHREDEEDEGECVGETQKRSNKTLNLDSASNIDSICSLFKAKKQGRLWNKKVSNRQRLDTTYEAYSNTSVHEQEELERLTKTSVSDEKEKDGVHPFDMSSDSSRNENDCGGGGRDDGSDTEKGATSNKQNNDKIDRTESSTSSVAYKTDQERNQLVQESIIKDQLEGNPEFMRRFLYKNSQQSHFHFIQLKRNYVAIQDNKAQYLGCIDGKVVANNCCVFSHAYKGNNSQLWICKFRDLNPAGPSFKFTIHNKANPDLVLEIGKNQQSLCLKKLKCGWDSVYGSTEFISCQLFKVNDTYSDIIHNLPSLTMTPPHMKTFSFDCDTLNLLGKVKKGNIVKMEPCNGTKYQRFNITPITDSPGKVTIDLHYHNETELEELNWFGKKKSAKEKSKKEKTVIRQDLCLAHRPKITKNSNIMLVNKTKDNKANNEIFKLIKVQTKNKLDDLLAGRAKLNVNNEESGEKFGRTRVRIHSAACPEYIIYVHKHVNYMLDNTFELRMRKWKDVVKCKKSLISKCYFDLWEEGFVFEDQQSTN